MPAMLNGNQLVLTGAVGDDMGWGWGDCFTSSDVILALAQVGDTNDIVIRLNSGGGIATEGSAIHSAIARHKGKKTVIVEGIAASAASIIAMAGDDVVMSLGAMLMIHDPSGFTVGTIVDHQAQITCLTALGDAMSTIYAAKSGMTPAECRADMQAEVWLTADQAVEKGYADRVEGSADATDEPEPAPFNYRMYAHTPERIVALADARQWSKRRPAANIQHDVIEVIKSVGVTASSADLNQLNDATLKVQTMTDDKKAGIDAAVAAATATSVSRADASEIAKLCIEGSVPTMIASLLAEGATIEQAKAKINSAGQIKDMVALARGTNPAIPETLAATMVAAGKTVEQARAELFDQLVAKHEETVVTAFHRAGAGGTDRPGGEDAKAARERSKANMKAQIDRNPAMKKEA